MIDLTTQLIPLIRKEPIVSTFDSRTIISHPEDVVTSYDQHAATYVELDLLRDIGQRFIDKIARSQTPKVCLVARYGYGKTSAAIGLWQACRKAHILSVPPAGYTSLVEIASTVYSWARTALHENQDALTKLGELYSTYLRSSTEDLAKLVSKRSGHPYEQIIEILTDPALEGSLRLDPPSTNIVLFFEALTHIVASNGYSGVAVFVDEFQQLLGKAGADILTALRSLVWGLRTRNMPFGLVITMDPNSERVLGERAGDILHRIKDDDLYLDFQQIHGSDFPRLLWGRYIKQLGLEELTYRIVDKPTLEALGQVCERIDLSNGPRTVANVFRRIASYYASTEKTYTPLQLIEDFLTGAVIFEGDANTIASLVTEFAGYAYFKRTDAHLAVLKLLAAFPSGCPLEVAERYGHLETFKEITTELRGDIVTLLPGGYALIDLQRVGKPLNKLSLILKKYWMQISASTEEPEEDIRRFAKHVLPLLFPLGNTQSESWEAESALSLTPEGAYTQTLVGNLHTRHPLRRINISVCFQEISRSPASSRTDIDLMFVIHNDATYEQTAFIGREGTLVFHLNIGRAPQGGLPPDLRLVEHNLSPQPSTPAALLNVLEFVAREAATSLLKQSELLQINYTLKNIHHWLLNFMFNEYLMGAVDPETATPGYRGVRDLLFRECERRFPRYNTLITSNAWQDNLALYRRVLGEKTLSERRGIEPVRGPKAEIAALFGQRNHAGFDSKLRVQYPFLLDITWVGEHGTLLFTSHPIETSILAFLGDEGRTSEEVVELCRAEGYAEEEIGEILALLTTRGQIKEETERIHKTDSLSISELRRAGEELFKDLGAMEIVLPREDLELPLAIAHSLAALNSDDELGHRQRGHAQLIVLTEAIAKLRAHARLAYLEKLEHQRDELAKLLRDLDEIIPGFSEPVSFKNHLDGVRKHLEEESASIRRAAVRQRVGIQSARNRVITLDDSGIGAYLELEADRLRQRNEALRDLETRFVSHQQKIQLLKQWVNWGERFTRLRQSITKLVLQLTDAEPISAQLAKVLDDLENEVRESFSHYGIATLERIGHVQRLLDDVAREYDRSLSEREMAFEKEKALLAAFLISIAGSGKSLRSKYQVSKDEESYHDLYLEVLQIANEAVDSLMRRVRLLDSSLEDIRGEQARENSASVDRRALRTQARKVTDDRKSLLKTQELGELPGHFLLETFAEDLNSLREQLDEAERKVSIQAPLSLSAEALLARVRNEAQDLRALIDVKITMSKLAADSDLTALLELYLSGDVVIEVYRKSHG